MYDIYENRKTNFSPLKTILTILFVFLSASAGMKAGNPEVTETWEGPFNIQAQIDNHEEDDVDDSEGITVALPLLRLLVNNHESDGLDTFGGITITMPIILVRIGGHEEYDTDDPGEIHLDLPVVRCQIDNHEEDDVDDPEGITLVLPVSRFLKQAIRER